MTLWRASRILIAPAKKQVLLALQTSTESALASHEYAAEFLETGEISNGNRQDHDGCIVRSHTSIYATNGRSES